MDAQRINHQQAVARRRKTVFRKLRQLCLQYNYKAVVLIADEQGNNQWLYKTHDQIPGLEQIQEHPRTKNNNDDFLPLTSADTVDSADNRHQLDLLRALTPPTFNKMSPDIIITPIKHALYQQGHKTTDIERLPSILQESKNEPPPTIVDLLRENGRLRQELAYHQELSTALMDVLESTKLARRILDEALLEMPYFPDAQNALAVLKGKFSSAYSVIKEGLRKSSYKISSSESRLLEFFGITFDDTEGRDFTII
ncbi:hypothetical protein TSTA_084360 [Talaromyces stipitatus ATCC 10500]|uniref:MADS-box domain-containing protein n=1 Tax=Talaromyces stipitatus (strain ATCC 10500 / CBS 375.48 / QM 6759 / NRRL 1006) TaxID=441959 RepID=B8M0A8_TALSN|nr:uncharacterized protein TSTA_084360 [Talaromyces stipitatus ATCC 10500]EED21205.1 hypothetical protein TSTA_084360 [Talaromyces stipitatus ATCC 10500]